MILRDVGTGALIVANRQCGQTLKDAAGLVSALYGITITPTTACEKSLRWIELQRKLGVKPPSIRSSREVRRIACAKARRDRAERDLEATRTKLESKLARAGVERQEIPIVVAAVMRGEPTAKLQSKGAPAVAAERLGKILESQASVQALVPPPSGVAVGEIELRHLGERWCEHARALRSP